MSALEIWLKQIGLPLPEVSHASLLNDPLRNGTFICNLVELTQLVRLDIIRQPKNTLDCEHNFKIALDNLPFAQIEIEKLITGESTLALLEAIKSK